MQSFSAWVNDRKNLPYVVGALVGVIVVTLLVLRLMSGGGQPQTATGDLPPAPGAPTAGMPGEGMPPAPGVEAPGMPAPVAQAAAPVAAPTEAGKKEPPLEEARLDPFEPYLGPKPRRTKLAFTAQLPKPEVRRVAPIQVQLAQDQETLAPQPPRRMAGIVKNGRVFAIIVEERGDTPVTKIVKPGDMLDEDIVVDRIMADKVVLKSQRTGTLIDVAKSAGRVQPRTPGATPGEGRTPRMPRPGRPPGLPTGGPMEMPPPP